MESVGSRNTTIPMILGVVGGAFLGTGAFLNWATASVNWDAISAVIGTIPAEVRSQGTVTVTGWDMAPGKWMLVTAIVVVIASGLLAVASSPQVVAFVVIFGGAVGGSMALYKATAGKDSLIDDAARVLIGAALPGSLHSYVSVSIGVGVWLCVLGGVVAIVAGIVAMLGGRPSDSDLPGAP